MVTTALIFDHRNRSKSGELGTVELRITIDRKASYLSTGVRVLKKNFKNGVVVDRFDCDELNERLLFIKKKVEQEINRCLKENIPLNLSQLKNNLLEIDNKENTSFLDWVGEQIPLLTVTEERKLHFYTLLASLNEFAKIRKWDDLTVENIYLFDSWLHNKKKPQTKAQIVQGLEPGFIQQSTIHNYHKNLKAILHRALEMGKIDSVPYDRLKGKFKRCEKENIEYLTEDQMKLILDMTPVEGTTIATARDMFIIQMFTGLSYSDMQNLDLGNFKLINNKWIYNGERIKTGVPYVNQLLPPVVKVLTKYGWNVPKLSLNCYNETLKIIGTALGISTNMHSHLARHTFATYMLKNGVQIQNLSKMLGHTNIKQTQRYAKVLASSVHDDFDMIEEKIKNL